MPRPGRNDRAYRISGAVYRALLRAYPEEFRRDYGAQMEQTFSDLRHGEFRNGGKIGVAKLWTRTLLDLVATAFVERISGHGRVRDKERVVSNYRLAGLGMALLLAPLYFVFASLLKYGLGVGVLFDPMEAFLSVAQRREVFNLVSPLLFLGGLGLAVALNVYPVLRLNVGREDGMILGTIRIEIKPVNIAVVVVSSMLMSTLLGYAVLENFTIR